MPKNNNPDHRYQLLKSGRIHEWPVTRKPHTSARWWCHEGDDAWKAITGREEYTGRGKWGEDFDRK